MAIEERPELQGVHRGPIPPVMRHGNKGEPLKVACNYLRLERIDCEKRSGGGIFHYEVNFQPTVDARNQRFKMMAELVKCGIIQENRSFNGSRLYLPVQLRNERFKVPEFPNHIAVFSFKGKLLYFLTHFCFLFFLD